MAELDEFLFAEDDAGHSWQTEPGPAPTEGSWKLLIVDDERDVHDVTRMALKRLTFDSKGMEFLSAFSAAEAKEVLRAHPEIAVILLDVVMEEDDSGLALVRHIREELKNTMVRIIVRTGHPGEAPEESVTVEYDINDYKEKTELTSRSLRTALINALRSYRDIATIHDLNQEIEATQSELIYALGEIAESRSVETGHHVKRVGEIAGILARHLGLAEREAALLRLAASMHDLGKLAIHDSILKKTGPLTAAEYETMKRHSRLGYEILKRSKRPLLQMAATIAKEHHENYDGTGYPSGLKGEAISIYSRITALADVYDALGMKRSYKAAWPQAQILAYLREQRGKKFDPRLVDLFFQHAEEIARVRQLFGDGEPAGN
ncbi:response regulator RpfG family c-di-GMP phosphodiesterase [Hydrogenispora ethanolica]|uniref:Response regulator RpfG family c-di-GMP phosphodiesterase n=1 Tax=Hydrogenispora ethanolica TaxID=1082276 RepID=A0A4R1RUB6_HYDET|nr:HD domain-containing phosphohydrolase [Hydrogenispora ethanolica]TCL70056.1 response regulator RpfG family c-di-GMP phosphodiesterase [Hydrogenispora ethanolica]